MMELSYEKREKKTTVNDGPNVRSDSISAYKKGLGDGR